MDYVDRMALVATRGEGEAEEILAVVRYDRTAGEREAEVAFVVQDAWQGHGIATALLHSSLRMPARMASSALSR